MNFKKIGLFLGPLLFIFTRLFFSSEGLTDEANAVLASTLWIAVWWITETIPIAATSLLPIILFPLSGALPLAETSSSFGHRYVFLYMGGFILALAIEKWNLHKRIALNIIKLIGTDLKKIILVHECTEDALCWNTIAGSVVYSAIHRQCDARVLDPRAQSKF